MNICICDDESATHEIIKNHLQNMVCSNVKIFDFFSAEDLLNSSENFDILFLDIEMGKIDGLQAAESIRKNHSETIIIFISGHPHYVFKAFNVEAFHFLIKPIKDNEFKNVFDRAMFKYNSAHTSVSFSYNHERFVLSYSSIKYIEGYKRHLIVYTQNGSYRASGKIADLMDELAPHGFLRTHQGFVVNMDYIKRFEYENVILSDDTKVPISVRMRKEALMRFDDYLIKRKW